MKCCEALDFVGKDFLIKTGTGLLSVREQLHRKSGVIKRLVKQQKDLYKVSKDDIPRPLRIARNDSTHSAIVL